jgi:hypothetical protein
MHQALGRAHHAGGAFRPTLIFAAVGALVLGVVVAVGMVLLLAR